MCYSAVDTHTDIYPLPFDLAFHTCALNDDKAGVLREMIGNLVL